MTVEAIGRDEESGSISPGCAGSDESSKREGDRLSRCTYHFAKQAVVVDLELEAPVSRQEGAIAGQAAQRGDKALLDILRRELMKSLDCLRSFAEQLADQLQRLTGPLANKLAEPRGGQEKRLGILG